LKINQLMAVWIKPDPFLFSLGVYCDGLLKFQMRLMSPYYGVNSEERTNTCA
jgi:hypothetical protein